MKPKRNITTGFLREYFAGKAEVVGEYVRQNVPITLRCLKHNKLFTKYFSSIERHGVLCDQCTKEARASTMIKRFGVDNCRKSRAVKEKKTKATMLARYGVENPQQVKQIRAKTKQTNIDKYGFGCSFQNKEVRERFNKTCIERYGFPWPAQNLEISLKAACSRNNRFLVDKWDTKEELVCVASFEKKVVEFLNANRISFEWQQTSFFLPDGRVYTPDLYLVDQDLWVEIKGRWIQESLYKYNWFHSQHPNSEVWGRKELKQKGIL